MDRPPFGGGFNRIGAHVHSVAPTFTTREFNFDHAGEDPVSDEEFPTSTVKIGLPGLAAKRRNHSVGRIASDQPVK